MLSAVLETTGQNYTLCSFERQLQDIKVSECPLEVKLVLRDFWRLLVQACRYTDSEERLSAQGDCCPSWPVVVRKQVLCSQSQNLSQFPWLPQSMVRLHSDKPYALPLELYQGQCRAISFFNRHYWYILSLWLLMWVGRFSFTKHFLDWQEASSSIGLPLASHEHPQLLWNVLSILLKTRFPLQDDHILSLQSHLNMCMLVEWWESLVGSKMCCWIPALTFVKCTNYTHLSKLFNHLGNQTSQFVNGITTHMVGIINSVY